ncbi:pyridoxamine 5'-phosphate oxidase family protein [Actinomadura spongiicola]|uniref:pyridoxamine 5'-phosphate oxidase family protein n=1 Tax=Actinomadura spongiicola TaxID=2303421 RepID=UPI0011C10A5C|nr:pyridoxamine 5'-phosphate oxidase family protein [Actinomadura spongiicola]
MDLDAITANVLSETRVLEFTTLTGSGGLNTRPMSGTWLRDRGKIVLTTPVAYPQRARNVRRDGRVALLYSDPAGSGLPDMPTVLIQGMATAPEIVAPPQDLEEYWRTLFRRRFPLADGIAAPAYRRAMGWFFWRLPIFVTPLRVDVGEPVTTGGAGKPPPPDGAPMNEQIKDALTRYPTAVLAARDEQGFPYSTRARVSWSASAPGTLRLRPSRPFHGIPGPANLLWHRHNGLVDDRTALLVTGEASDTEGEWTMTPARIPGLLPSGRREPSSFDEWIEDGWRRTHTYFAAHGITPPDIDWNTLTSYTNP